VRRIIVETLASRDSIDTSTPDHVPLPIYRFSQIHSMLSLWGVEVEGRLGGHIERL
jgi:hypothetical protein